MTHVAHARRNHYSKISEFCPERAYLELEVPANAEHVVKLVVRVRSHDQGYCDDKNAIGHPGFTWFEGSVVTPSGRNAIPRRLLCRNTAANWEWENHVVCLERDDPDVGFVDKLRAQDVVQVIPKARWAGWVNFIEMVEIEIHYTVPDAHFDHIKKHLNRRPPYRPLSHSRQSIRLLVVQPGTKTDALTCEIVTTDLSDHHHTAYEALSYCWGNDEKQLEIRVSLQGEAPIWIDCSASLHSALLHLRYPERPRVIWADAICINQADTNEVADQVGMMGQIYSRAQAVLVWLGDGDTDTQAATHDLRDIFVHYKAATEEQIAQGTFRGSLPYVDEAPDGLHRLSALIDRTSRFFSLPWFWRAWVVQEVWLSRKTIFHHAQDTVEWDIIWKAHNWMNIRAFNTPGVQQITLPLVWSTLKAKSEDGNSESRLSLLDLVLQSLDLKASDPRDKVFALLGLAEETHSGRISSADHLIYPDYTKSTSAVFADFTRWWILQHKSLRILSAIHATEGRSWQSIHCTAGARQNAQQVIGHPTWALWHSGKSKWISESLGFATTCNASGNTQVATELLGTPTECSRLTLRGIRLGTILSISAFRWREHAPDMCDVFNRLFDASGARRIFNGPVTTNLVLHEDGWDGIGRHVHAHCEETPYDVHSLPCLDDCFCTISGDRIGLCPAGTRVSDTVVVLYGGSVPYIIREAASGGLFEFVGECYVHGAMDGSAMIPPPYDKGTEEDFVLV